MNLSNPVGIARGISFPLGEYREQIAGAVRPDYAPAMRPPPAPGLVVLFGALALGCAHNPFSAPTPPSERPPAVIAAPQPDLIPAPPPIPVTEGVAWFRIGDRVVRESELDAWIREDLFDRELAEADPAARWGYRAEAAERMIDELILREEARRRGIEPERVLSAEIAALGPVTAAELLDFFEENRERWPAEMIFEDAAPDIRAYLEGQRPRQARENLRRRARVRFLQRPPGGSRNPANARNGAPPTPAP